MKMHFAYRFLATLAVVTLVVGCSDGPAAPVIDGTGEFTGAWDGSAWLGRGYAVLRGDTLHLIGHRPDTQYYYDEYVNLHFENRGSGTYALPGSGAARLMKITGGDAGWFPDAIGRVTIRVGPTSVSGSLELYADGPDGKLWRFERGRFSVPLYEEWSAVPVLR